MHIENRHGIMNQQFRPLSLRFEPLYKPVIWGGISCPRCLAQLPESSDPIGDPGSRGPRRCQSVVANGPLKGKNLRNLINECGTSSAGVQLPRRQAVSLLRQADRRGQRCRFQVHPERNLPRIGNGAEPKTEMWYIISAKTRAKIIAAKNPRTTRQQLISSN